MKKLFARWLTAGIIAGTAAVGLPGAATAQTARTGTPASVRLLPTGERFWNRYDGRCLDEDLGGGVHDGSIAHVWTCLGVTADNQYWTHYSDGEIRNSYDNRCLDENLGGGSFNGQIVHLWTCNYQPNQKWTIQPNGWIINQYDGRCLDENLGGGSFNGQKVQVWDCLGTAGQANYNQSWGHP